MSLRHSPTQIVQWTIDSGNPGLLANHGTWERIPLGSVAAILNGAAYKSDRFNTSGSGLPLIRIRDVGSDRISTYYDGPYDPVHVVQRGDLLVGMDGDFRASPWHGRPGLLNQRVCRIDVNEQFVHKAWIQYALQGYLDAIWDHTSAVTVKHLSSRTVGEIPVPLPPLAEQHRIVEVLEDHLSHLDVADGLLVSAFRRLEKWAAKSAVEEFYGEHSTAVSTIGHECEVSVGATPSRGDSTLWDGDLPWVSSGEVAFNTIRDTKEHIDRSRFRNPKGRIHPPGTVMIAMIGEGKTRGQVAVLGIEAAHNQNCASIRVENSRLSTRYLYHFLKARYLETRAGGAGGVQPALNKAKVQAIEIPVLSSAAQHRIVERIEQIEQIKDRMLRNVYEQRKRIAGVRRALLEQAFAGTLVDQDPADEPASALLERIALERAQQAPASRRRRGEPVLHQSSGQS